MRVSFEEIVVPHREPSYSAHHRPDPPLDSPVIMPSISATIRARTGQRPRASRGDQPDGPHQSLALALYRWTVENRQRSTAVVSTGWPSSVEEVQPFPNESTADALNRPVIAGYAELPPWQPPVQAHGLGELSGLQEIRQVVRTSFPTETFEPHDPAPWDEAYGRFCQLTEAG